MYASLPLPFPCSFGSEIPLKTTHDHKNNCGLKTVDNPHPNLLNLAVIILYYGEEHVGANQQRSRLNRGNIHALLWRTLQLL